MFDHDAYITKRAVFNYILVRERGRKYLENLKTKGSKGRIQLNYTDGALKEGGRVSVSSNPTSAGLFRKLADTSFIGPPVALTQVMDELVRWDAPELGFKKTEVLDGDGRLSSIVVRPPRTHRVRKP